MSLSLLLSPTQFQQLIMELFPKLRNNFYLYRLVKAKKLQRLLVESPADLKPHKYSGAIILSNEQFSEPNQQCQETTGSSFNIANERSETILPSPFITPHHSSSTALVLNASPIVSSNLLDNSERINHIFNGGTSELSTSSETSSLQSIRAEQFSKLCGIHQVIIQRSKIISDAVNFYKSYDVTSSNLYVKFNGEEGEDVDGVTREFFSSFWNTFRKQHME